jgi:hypothetical protein
MKCKICGDEAHHLFNALVLNKYDVKYYFCEHCGFIFTEEPFWLNEAYSNAINLNDTGLLQRNLYFSRVLSAVLFFLFDTKAKYLDYAGGYGIFTRLMRDNGFDFYWSDPYCENILSKGFEIENANTQTFLLLSAFEVFEHLVNPIESIEKMFKIADNIVFSTELVPTPTPGKNDWWYYCFEHGQHVAFYKSKSLEFIARKFNVNYYFASGIHFFSKRKINKTTLKVIAAAGRYGLATLIRRRLKSKVWDDYLYLKKLMDANTKKLK